LTVGSAARSKRPKNRVATRSLRLRVLSYVKTPVIGASVTTLADLIILPAFLGSTSKTTLVLVLLLEGGLGLIAGSAIALSSTPSISKTGEIMFGRAPWSKEGERNAERVAGKWMIASTLLIIIGFALAAT
jgi:hypothetical protein